MKKLLVKTILFALMFGLISCADSDDNNDGTERPSGTNGWSEVRFEGEVSNRGPNCDSPVLFTVLSDGRLTKTCGQAGQSFSAVLSADERTKLDALAGNVADNDLSAQDCTSGSPQEYAIDMIMDDNSRFRIFEINDADNETCWLGSRPEIVQLRDYIRQLIGKYHIPTATTTTTTMPGTTTTTMPGTTTTTMATTTTTTTGPTVTSGALNR